MPVYRAITHEDPGQPAPVNGISSVVAEIEAKGERIVTAVSDGGGCLVLITEPKAKRSAGAKETR